jgi:ferredoxin
MSQIHANAKFRRTRFKLTPACTGILKAVWQKQTQPKPGGTMAIVIDHEECIGCETCVELCPEVFAMMDGEEKALVKAPDSKADCVQDAIDGCPVEAISRE